MAKSKTPPNERVRQTVIDLKAYQEALAELQKKFLQGVPENKQEIALTDMKIGNTKTLRKTKSSRLNLKWQPHVDDWKELKEELNKVFKDGDQVLIKDGKKKIPTLVKLIGYNSATGDTYVSYKDADGNFHESKKAKIITDISDL